MTNRFKTWALVLASALAANGYADAAPATESAPLVAAAPDATGTCKGTILDTYGDPMVGVTVRVKDSKVITTTNIDGEFTINNLKIGSTLTFTYIGCTTQEVVWDGAPIQVTLAEDSNVLNEVVVVGYGVQKKVNVTGAVSMVDEKAFASRPVTNVQQALQGAIPGLNLNTTTSGGELNASMSMDIRGTGTIGDGSVAQPLVLIDGIEGSMNMVNPNDIQSVSVLKDAAAASIYGSRAAFGVILITTKNGSDGKVNISYSGDVRFTTATQLPDMANSLEWATYFNAAQYNENGGYVFSPETMENIQKFLNGEFTDPSTPEYYGTTAGSNGRWNNYGSAFANTDWFAEHYKKNVPSTQHNLSLSGGTQKVQWLISGSYLLNNGLIRHGHDEYNRYTMNAKIGAELASWARVDYSTKWSRVDYERPFYMNGHFYHNIARRWPTCPVIDPNGHYMNEMEIAELEDMGIYYEKTDKLTQQLKFTFTPLAGWNIVFDGGLTTTNAKTKYNMDPVYYYDCNDEPFIRDSDYGTTSYVVDQRTRTNYYSLNIYTDYTRSFGLHNGKILVGMNYEKYDTDYLYGDGSDMTDHSKPYLSQTQSDFSATDSYNHRATAGYFARLNYDYDGKYLLEGNIRYDGSSRFLADRRWAWFPSVSAGWNIARENFFRNLTNQITTLKLRASYGSLGNTSSAYSSFWDWYPFYQQQSIGANNSGWLINGAQQNTASLPSIVNATMTWETVKTIDIGFDVAALNNRLTATFDWYTRKTENMIGPAPILGSVLGTDAPNTNNCDMRTNGWEIEIGWNDRIGSVNYNARVNISDNTSKILEYPYDGEFGAQSYSGYHNGMKFNEIWGYKVAGIANSQEEMDAWIANNNPSWGSNWGAGDIMYMDLNGDGKVNSGEATIDDHGDLVVIGNSSPRYRIGINLGLEWKGIDFSAFFQGVMKRDWLFGSSEPYFWGGAGGMWQSTVFKEHLDYWTPENTDAYYPRPYFGTSKNRYNSDRYIQNAAYLRCKNMQLGYSLPTKTIAKAGLSLCRIYVSVDNLFTITSMSSVFDPEALSGSWGAGKLYPLTRTWSVGVNLNF